MYWRNQYQCCGVALSWCAPRSGLYVLSQPGPLTAMKHASTWARKKEAAIIVRQRTANMDRDDAVKSSRLSANAESPSVSLGSKRVIQHRFNVGVPRARVR